MGVPNNDPFSEDYDPSLSQDPVVTGMCEVCEELIFGPHMKSIIEKLGGRKTLVIAIHGSHLYGLNHKDSDVDIKGVFLPFEEEILLGRVQDTIKFTTSSDDEKCGKDDVEAEFYSLHHFFKLLADGDTGAISLLYVPFNQTCSQHDLWERVVENKNLFIAKEMAGLIGFVRTQVNKYCIKGERLAAANKMNRLFANLMIPLSGNLKLGEVWDKIPFSRHITMVMVNDQRFLEVCGRKIQDTNTIDYANKVVISIINSYGNRAIDAEKNDGIDWKAVSHAFRVASELTDLYENGIINYPLKDAERIKSIKMGELDYDTEVLPGLNSLMDLVQEKSQKSNFPDKVDKEKIDNLLLDLIKSIIEGCI